MTAPTQPEPFDLPRDANAGRDELVAHASLPETTEPPVEPHRSGLDSQGRVKRTRAATAWASAVALALVTILFVVFVVQNSQSITIDFLWMNGEISAAAALPIAAVAGSLLVGIPAAVRIGQLRRSLKRNG